MAKAIFRALPKDCLYTSSAVSFQRDIVPKMAWLPVPEWKVGPPPYMHMRGIEIFTEPDEGVSSRFSLYGRERLFKLYYC